MTKPTTQFLAMAFALSFAPPLAAQTTVPPVVGVTRAEIDAVLKHVGPEGAGVDRQIRVADIGSEQIGIGVLHRGPTKPGAPVAAITHSQVTEVFYVLSGSATLVTGTAVANDRAFPSETEFVRLAVGPSSGGVFTGGDRRPIAAGDVIVVPAGVPHGFDNVTDHITYLSIRPDPKRVLPANYAHPLLRK